MRPARGLTLLETIVYLVLVLLAASAVLPALARMRGSALAAAGTRHLAVTLHALRWKSLAQGKAHGLHFVEGSGGWSWFEVRDENGNGLRTAEVARGVDATLGGPYRLQEIAPGVRFGLPPHGPIPRIPPAAGWVDDLDDPVQLGNTRLLSFSPSGSSSSGTLYVTDASGRLYGIVLFGRTARIRVARYVSASERWTF